MQAQQVSVLRGKNMFLGFVAEDAAEVDKIGSIPQGS